MDKPKPFDFTVLSLGAGVQSTAMLIMSNLGLYDCPRADVAIFADTGDEPQYVYDHLKKLREWSRIPIQVVSSGRLSDEMLTDNGRPRQFLFGNECEGMCGV